MLLAGPPFIAIACAAAQAVGSPAGCALHQSEQTGNPFSINDLAVATSTWLGIRGDVMPSDPPVPAGSRSERTPP